MEDIIARFCYYYPQYTYHFAYKNLPFKRIVKMLSVARKEQALMLYNITRAIAAPHTKKGSGVKSLLDEFKKVADI
ncbi:MAG: hypothetical protein ACEQR7_10090 [Agathobacter rectalis]